MRTAGGLNKVSMDEIRPGLFLVSSKTDRGKNADFLRLVLKLILTGYLLG